MKKILGFNVVEWSLMICSIFVAVLLCRDLEQPYRQILPSIWGGFLSSLGTAKQQNKTKNKYPTLADIQRKYPKRKPVETPTDGIYEDFSRDITPVKFETMQLEVSENSYKTLLRMVYGDKELAATLIRSNLFEGRSANWACEKAIADLIRDRQ